VPDSARPSEEAEHISTTELRVRYAETDQMGVAHHSTYLVWCEEARTSHMRSLGVSYREMEERGLFLPVVEAHLRYRAAARYDDRLQVRCWVRDTSSRRVVFGYAVDRPADGKLLATAQTALIAVDSTYALTTIPPGVREKLVVVPDPVRL
jgi:acyl-CoA thioester hydrolase